MCFVFHHDLFDDVKLHCLRRWSKVKKKGSPEHFFAKDTRTEEPSDKAEQGECEMPMLEGNEYDVFRLQAEGYKIDNDNELAPENAPSVTPSNNTGTTYGNWVFSGISQRRAEGLRNYGAHLLKVSSDLVMSRLDMMMMFVMFMPKDFFESVILVVETNKAIQGPPITFGKFLQFIGIWLYMAMMAGFNQANWFSGKNIDCWDGAPCRFNAVMSGWRFEAIIVALRFMQLLPHPFKRSFMKFVTSLVHETRT
jgi:hypothetical protein